MMPNKTFAADRKNQRPLKSGVTDISNVSLLTGKKA